MWEKNNKTDVISVICISNNSLDHFPINLKKNENFHNI